MNQTSPPTSILWDMLKVFPILVCMTSSCTDAEEKKTREKDRETSEAAAQIKQALSGKTLSLLDMGRTMVSPKHSRIYDHISAVNKYKEPDWDTYSTCKDADGSDILVFKLESEEPFCCYSKMRENGKQQSQIGNVISRLAVRKVGEEYVARILTYVPAAGNGEVSDELSELGFEPEVSGFSGMRIVSSIEGIFLFGDIYRDGSPAYNFTREAQNPDSIPKQGERYHIEFRLFGKNSNFANRLSRNGEDDYTTCVVCGGRGTKCECGVVVKPANPLEPYCPVCQLRKEFCTCYLICPQCNRYPCVCYSGGYTGGNHGGGSAPEPPKEEKKILADVRISLPASKYPGYDVLKDCHKVCDYVLDILINGYNSGNEVKRFIKRKDAQGNLLPFNKNTDVSMAEMFNLINASLDAKRPLKAGLDYWSSGLNNGDHITDHWVVILGRTYDAQKGQYYFTYIETARGKGCAPAAVGDNRLYYDMDKGVISGERYKGDDIYFVNQIKIDNGLIK